MGNETRIRFALHRDEAPFPEVFERQYQTMLNGLYFFPVNRAIPFCDRQGRRMANIEVESFTKFMSGKTLVFYKYTKEPLADVYETPVEFNWILKLHDDSGVLEARLSSNNLGHTFEKEKDPVYRDFPVGIPMELWRYPRAGEDVRAVALAKICIGDLTVGNGKTSGSYAVRKIFSPQEREMMNKNFL